MSECSALWCVVNRHVQFCGLQKRFMFVLFYCLSITVLICKCPISHADSFFGVPYLTLPLGRMPARQTPSAEATAQAQCASPTDLKVDRASLKLWQTSGGDANGYHSAYPMEE